MQFLQTNCILREMNIRRDLQGNKIVMDNLPNSNIKCILYPLKTCACRII